jgi:hypothetical protein
MKEKMMIDAKTKRKKVTYEKKEKKKGKKR